MLSTRERVLNTLDVHEPSNVVFCVQAGGHAEPVMDYARRVSYTQQGVYHTLTRSKHLSSTPT